MKGGKPNGYGTCTSADGDSYVGEFKNGKPNGYGTCTFASGGKYVGKFKNGKKDGTGTETKPDGTIQHSGEWKNGQIEKKEKK